MKTLYFVLATLECKDRDNDYETIYTILEAEGTEEACEKLLIGESFYRIKDPEDGFDVWEKRDTDHNYKYKFMLNWSRATILEEYLSECKGSWPGVDQLLEEEKLVRATKGIS
jgi:hypothetical protein